MKKTFTIILITLMVFTVSGCTKTGTTKPTAPAVTGGAAKESTDLDKDIKDLDNMDQDMNTSDLDNLNQDLNNVNW